MVTFSDTGFTIEVETGTNPIDAWMDTHSEMVDCLQSEEDDKHAYRYHYLELLRNMLPDYDTALRLMHPKLCERIKQENSNL